MICRASSRIALTPLPGSRPACADTPRATSSNCPTPLRLVFNAPPGNDGSNTSTASLFDASASISAREVVLPISSSVVHSMTIWHASSAPRSIDARASPAWRGRCRLSCRTRRDRTACPPSRLSGMRCELADRPHGVEVAEQKDLPRTRAECRAQVIAGGRRGHARDRPPIASSRDASSAPQRLTAAGSSLGDSIATSASIELEQPVVIGEAVVEEAHRGPRVLRS